MKRFLVSGIASGALALTLLAGGYAATANAAAPTAPATQATAAPTSAPATPKQRTGRAGRVIGGQFVRTLSELTKLQPADIVKELRAGKSMATIASEHGSSADALISAARAKFDTRLKQAVADGKHTQAQADAALKRFDEQAPILVNRTDLGKIGRPGKPVRAGIHGLVAATASVTGLTEAQVQAELKSGKTIAQIAQAHGKTLDDVLAKLREQGQQRLDGAIDKARQRLNSPKTTGA